MGLFNDSNDRDSWHYAIDRKFVTTLPEIKGYTILEQKGAFFDVSDLTGVEGSMKGIINKALAEGCNAIVNLRITTGYGSVVVYGDGVVINK